MSRSNSFIGVLKRLFKDPPKHADMPETNASLKVIPCALGDLDTTSNVSLCGTASDCAAAGKLSRSCLVASNSGPFSSSVSSAPTSTIFQGGLCHSISDPCDELSTMDSDGGWLRSPVAERHRKPGRLGCMSTSQLLVAEERSPVAYKSVPCPELVLPSLRDAVTGQDVQGVVTISANLLPDNRPGGSQLVSSAPVPLPRVDSEATMPDAMPTLAGGILLAMCSATPDAMRRRNWRLEDYSVSRRLYKGNASAVYKATCRCSGLPVALKVYFLSHVPANVVHMIVREIKIQADLVHDNVVMLYGAFQDKTRLVLVQEYAARGDLYRIHRAMNRSMTEEQLTTLILRPFIDALTYLHAKGICHRDIKPENILFTQDRRLVLADFGVSISMIDERAVTRAGTLEYMAPEVERCPLKMLPDENKNKESLAYTTAVDVWATGVLAWELLVGSPPFAMNKPLDGANAGVSTGTALLTEHSTLNSLSFPAAMSPGARDFISRSLAARPEERPTSAQLSRHPWLVPVTPSRPSLSEAALRQAPVHRSSSQLSNGGSPAPSNPSRLGNTFVSSVPPSGVSEM